MSLELRMPKLHYFDSNSIDLGTYNWFAYPSSIETRFNPRKSVFLFPSNIRHHTEKHSLYSKKSGLGLAKAAASFYDHEIPTLGLPTTGMPAKMSRKQIEESRDFPATCAKRAIYDIWQALGFGFDLVCPVRQRKEATQYFSEALTANKEARLWGNIEKNPNIILGDYYHEQLKLINLATTAQNQEHKNGEDPILAFMESGQSKIDPLFIEAYKQGKAAANQLLVQGKTENSWFEAPLTWNVPETEKFAEGFKKIYTALREGESGFNLFKTNFIAGKEQLDAHAFISEIKKHAQAYPKSRTAKALGLAKRHLREEIPNHSMTQNGNLFKDIYLAAFAASRRWSFGLFKRSRIEKGKTIYKISTLENTFREKMIAAPTELSPGSRTEKINSALNRSFSP